MFYFYCPKCGHEEKGVKKLPRMTVGNLRDGFGTPIHHFKCPMCGNLDAGYMRNSINTEEELKYYQCVIKMYQDIRGYDPDFEKK